MHMGEPSGSGCRRSCEKTTLKGVGSSCYPSSIACEGGEQGGRCDVGAPVPRGQQKGRYGGERMRSQSKRPGADGSNFAWLRWSCCDGNRSVCQRCAK